MAKDLINSNKMREIWIIIIINIIHIIANIILIGNKRSTDSDLMNGKLVSGFSVFSFYAKWIQNFT